MCEGVKADDRPSNSIFPFSLGYLSKEKSKKGMLAQHSKKPRNDPSVVMMINSSIPSSSNSTQFLPNEDDDTEKYLTTSSKSSKLKTKKFNEDDSIMLQSKKIESEFFDSSSIENGGFEDEIVVTLLSSPAHGDNQARDDLSDDTQPSLSGERRDDVYLSVPFSTDHSAHLTSPSSGDSMIYAELHVDSEDGAEESPFHGYDLNSYKSHKLGSRKLSVSKKGPLPASVSLMEDPVRNLWVTSKCHKEQLKECGHSWTTGMWSREETRILNDNINKYCLERGITDPNTIIFESSKEERKDFYPSISVGLNRPLFAVYRRVKRLYDQKNHKGRYSSEELDKLKRLTKIHGRDWSTIGRQLGRSSDSVKDRARLIRDDLISGKWTESEEELLADAVHAVTRTKKGQLVTEGIPWSTVANMVGNRTEKQCRSKWLNYLNWKLLRGKEWTKEDDRLLVQKIVAINPETENEINWNEISSGWSSVRSPTWLRRKWADLKKILYECGLTDINFTETLKLLDKLFSEDIFKVWKQPKQLVKFLVEVHKNKSASDGGRKKVQSVKKKPSNPRPPNDITTSIVSQQDETSSAPLFIQSGSPDHLLTSDFLSAGGGKDGRGEHSAISSAPRPSSVSNQSKEDFEVLSTEDEFVCDSGGDGTVSLPQGTYHLTPTSSAGIFLIQSTEDPTEQESTLGGETSRMVNITLPPDVLKSLLKSDESSSPVALSLNDATDHEYLAHNSSSQDHFTKESPCDITIESQGDDDVSIYVT